MESWEVLKIAFDGNAKGVANELRKRGKRAGARFVYRQAEKPADVNRTDPYGQFKLWFASIHENSPKGASFLLADFECFVIDLFGREKTDLIALMVAAETEHSDIIKAVIYNSANLGQEILEDIAAKRRLFLAL
jgi:hypothetical protein